MRASLLWFALGWLLVGGPAKGAAPGENGRKLVLQAPAAAGVNSVAVSPDGSLVAAGADEGGVRLYDAKTGALMRAIGGVGDRGVSFSPDGRLLTAAGFHMDKLFGVVDVQTGKRVHSLAGHTEWEVYASAMSPDGKLLASGSIYDTKVYLRDPRDGSVVSEFEAGVQFVIRVAFSPDGKRLAVVGNAKEAKIFDIKVGDAERAAAEWVVSLAGGVHIDVNGEEFVTNLASEGKTILFVGTKRQAQDVIAEESQRCGMFYVNERWLGGLLTNFSTIQRSLGRLRDLEAMATDGRYDTLSKKEIARNEKERRKLTKNLEGIRGMSRLPDAVFIVDTKKEKIAVDESRKLKIPVIGIVDTNSDPDEVDFVIPGNDDALRSIRLFAAAIANAVISGRDMKQSVDAEAAREAAEEGAANAGEDPRRAARPIRRREAAPASA